MRLSLKLQRRSASSGLIAPGPDVKLLGRVCGNSDGNVAVLAVDAASSVKLLAGGTPNACCRALFGGLHVSGRVADGATLFVDEAGSTNFVGQHVSSQVRNHITRVNGEGTHTVRLTYGVEINSKERVGRL